MISLTALTRNLFDLALSHHCPLCECQCIPAPRRMIEHTHARHQYSAFNYLCIDCQNSLQEIQISCQRCDLPLATKGICPQCQHTEQAYDQIRCAYVYTPLIANLIFRYKSGQDLILGRQLSETLSQKLYRQVHSAPQFKPDFLIPVPMFWRAQVKRGFNQASDIERHLSRNLNIPVLNGLAKSSPSSSQKQLSRKARLRAQKNIDYRVCQSVQGHKLAIIDDVVTTAATAQTLSKLLKQAGATRVEIWALARTPVIK